MHALVTSGCWGLVVLTWVAAAVAGLRRPPPQRHSAGAGASWRIGIVVVVVALFLLGRHELQHLVVHSAWVEIPGLVLLVAATIFTLWARAALGKMWSISPDIVQDQHRLRTDGPYGITRHPIYTGLTGMLLGTALFNGLGTLTFVPILGVSLWATRVPVEERLMSETFPEEYARYRERVPQLVPGLRLRFKGHETESRELSMSDMNEWNRQIIAEFKANDGVVGGDLAGFPILLLHHTGAKSGLERVNPLVYQRVGNSVAVFASKGGAPTNPDWYYNLVANPEVTVEIGTETHSATARVTGDEERQRVWSTQKERFPNFAEYEEQAAPRQIPVVVLDLG